MKLIIKSSAILLLSGLISACVTSNRATDPQPQVQETIPMDLAWSHTISSGSKGAYDKMSPTLTGDYILVATKQGSLTCINKRTGKITWQAYNKAGFTSSPGASEDAVFVGDSNGKLFAFSLAKGKLLWSSDVADPIEGTPAYSNNVLVVKTLEGNAYGYDASTGEKKWTYNEGNPQIILKGASNPVIRNNQVYIGFDDGKLDVINLNSGQLIWQKQVAEPQGFTEMQRMVDINASPVVSNNLAYVATYQGNVSAFQREDGERIWEHELSTYSGLEQDNEGLYTSDVDGVIWAFNKHTGAVNWRQTGLQGYTLSAPLNYKDYLIVADNMGNLQLLSKQDGHFISRTKVANHPIYVTPLTDGNFVYVYSSDGALSALKLG